MIVIVISDLKGGNDRYTRKLSNIDYITLGEFVSKHYGSQETTKD